MTPISSLTKDELSHWIAIKMEPKPNWLNETKGPSCGGWWYIPLGCYWDGDKAKQPRSYDEPEIAIRLLKSLIDDFDFEQAYEEIRETPSAIDGLERAIAEAWALANGWRPV